MQCSNFDVRLHSTVRLFPAGDESYLHFIEGFDGLLLGDIVFLDVIQLTSQILRYRSKQNYFVSIRDDFTQMGNCVLRIF